MRAWPVARSIFDAPLGYVREANERTTGWISPEGRLKQCETYFGRDVRLTGDARLEFLRSSGPAPEMREPEMREH